MICIFGASGNRWRGRGAPCSRVGRRFGVVGRKREKLAALAKAGAESCVGDIENAGFRCAKHSRARKAPTF